MREYDICPYCKGSGTINAEFDPWSLIFGGGGVAQQCSPCFGSGLTFVYVDPAVKQRKHDMMMMRMQISYGFVVANPTHGSLVGVLSV